jgi:hypothetical protein
MSDSKPRKGSDSPETPEEGAEERQEKVLHTRISPTLDREIKRRARGLGMSVSTVVRNVLLHTFDLVEDIVNDSAGVALSLAGDEVAARSDASKGSGRSRAGQTDDPGEVIAWQEAVLNLNAVCDRCNTILASGTKAAIGIRDTPGPRSIICTACVEALGSDPSESD